MFDCDGEAYDEALVFVQPPQPHVAHWTTCTSTISTEHFLQAKEIKELFSAPIDWWEDAKLWEVAQDLRSSPWLTLPADWPEDW